MTSAIIPECFVDTCLVNTFLTMDLRRGANHAKGNSTVATKMQNEFRDDFAVGVIDRDKREIKYIREFQLINDTIPDKLKLYKHQTRHHYFIQLCPESESWICAVAADLGISMQEYGLPQNPRELARESKNVSVSADRRFVGLFKEIRKRAGERNYLPVIKLIRWLEQLRDNTYSVNIENLIN